MKAAQARNMLMQLSISPYASALCHAEKTRLGESKEDERQTPGADVKHGASPIGPSSKHWAIEFLVFFPLSFLRDLLRGIIGAVADQYKQDDEDFSEELLTERGYLV